ncbi:(2Fe-2S) ferredoxin domain-containing protein [Aneurinibacillus sp. BA2021]|nr:(2Fe-2S) ferredoxin domain-containing protein [Aneurinibacillus sp. BA2021]
MATRELEGVRHHLFICNGGSCLKRGGEEVTQSIRDQIARLAADDLIHTTRTRCNGRCTDACVVIHYPEGTWYRDMTEETGRELVRRLVHEKSADDADHATYTYQDGQFFSSRQCKRGAILG